MTFTSSRTRPPAVAGRFYQADAQRCAADAAQLCHAVEDAALPGAGPGAGAGTGTLYGGIVPHAGWVCSGRVAGLTWATLAAHTQARTIVLTGSVHTAAIWNPTLDSADAWQTPLGPVAVDVELRRALAELSGAGMGTLDMAHEREHSLEVNVPLIYQCFSEGVRIVPCLIPPVEEAAGWGRQIGKLLRDWHEPVIMVASSDLTHYGPNYRFTPFGVGEDARRWAHEENDRRLLTLIENMEVDRIVGEAASRLNACGGGAIAATMACCAELGATRGYVLAHTDSTAELAPLGHGDPNNSVGYAGVVFGTE